jgi:type IV secretory pathway VirB2 component (pilin)
MIIGIISSLVLFKMIPFLENFFQNEGTNNALENIKQFISFASPVIVIVCAIAGAAGYFMLKRVAWFTLLGFVSGLTIFLFTLNATSQRLNFGIYWIIMGSFFGGFIGSGIEFGYILKRRIHRELLPLLFIAAFSFFVGGFFLAQSNVSSNVELVSFQQLAAGVDYTLYEPAYLPDKFNGVEPKIFLNTTGGVSAYYGNDQYPPPPVIDFLTGIELIQSKRVEEANDIFDLEPGTVSVDLGDSQGRFSERRGRATIEWDQDNTHLVLNIYSNIPSTEMFKIARTLQPVLEAQE